MALSNWDTVAFGPDGNPTTGSFALLGGATLEMYKNWVYIHHPSAWFEGCGFSEDTVMQITSGNLEYAGYDILVERRALQSACFVYVSGHYSDVKGNFAAISCSAYLPLIEWIRRYDPDKLKLLPDGWEDMENFEVWSSEKGSMITLFRDDKIIDEVVLYGLGEEPDTLTGVTEELYQDFLSWLGTVYGDQEWFDKVKASEGVRYNQGDVFFAEAAGADIPGSPVGEKPADPVINGMIDQVFAGDENRGDI